MVIGWRHGHHAGNRLDERTCLAMGGGQPPPVRGHRGAEELAERAVVL
jgi:hypothetical protein